MALTVKLIVDGTNLTSKLGERTWAVNQVDGAAIDTMQFIIHDPDNSVTQVQRGKDVILEKSDDDTVRYFGGIVFRVTTIPVGLGRELHVIAQDWKIILDKSSFSARYTNVTDKAVIAAGFTAAELTEFNVTDDVEVIRTAISGITFQNSSVRAMLDQLADMTVATWGVDPFKKLFYRKLSRTSASASLSDAPDDSLTFPMQNSQRVLEMGMYNAVEIKGTKRASADVTDTYPGDGSQTFFKLGVDDKHAIYFAPDGEDRIQIYHNTGSEGSPSWAEDTVGLEGADTNGVAGITVLINILSGHVIFNTAPLARATNGWQIKGKYLSAVIGFAEDEDQIVLDGRMYKKSIGMGNVDNVDSLQDVADEFLNRNGPKDVIICDTEYDTFKIGQTLEVTNSIYGISQKLYYVEKIRLAMKGKTVSQSRMTLQSVKKE
jgi:hypothetical protein|tara:strand:- start:960 stop:2258 length:1299 start_codon:yes stop_codon:yes gene_type:complete